MRRELRRELRSVVRPEAFSIMALGMVSSIHITRCLFWVLLWRRFRDGVLGDEEPAAPYTGTRPNSGMISTPDLQEP